MLPDPLPNPKKPVLRFQSSGICGNRETHLRKVTVEAEKDKEGTEEPEAAAEGVPLLKISR